MRDLFAAPGELVPRSGAEGLRAKPGTSRSSSPSATRPADVRACVHTARRARGRQGSHAREVIASNDGSRRSSPNTPARLLEMVPRHGARLLHDLRASDSLRHHRPGHPEPHRDGVAAVASVSAGACQPEGARHGGEEAAEVACADRGEGASEAQAAEEDLARQVETRHACPAALRGGRVLGRKHLKKLQDARTSGDQEVAFRWIEPPQKRSGRSLRRVSVSQFHQRTTVSSLRGPSAAHSWRTSDWAEELERLRRATNSRRGAAVRPPLAAVPTEVVQSRGRRLVAEAAVGSSGVVSLEAGRQCCGASGRCCRRRARRPIR